MFEGRLEDVKTNIHKLKTRNAILGQSELHLAALFLITRLSKKAEEEAKSNDPNQFSFGRLFACLSTQINGQVPILNC